MHSIRVVAPKGLDLSRYENVISNIEVTYIDAEWLSSILSYNKLKLSNFFYNLFKDFEFLLTYELDAFVFKDELHEWIKKDYDYVGAPWFKNYSSFSTELMGVGNSGFSLRRVSSALSSINSIYFIDPNQYKRGYRKWLKACFREPFRWLLNSVSEENLSLQSCQFINEDVFFSQIVPSKIKNFKIAPVEDALRFSFEANPSYLFQLNNSMLPMGCHAWWRYDLEFWKPFIEKEGYNLRRVIEKE